MSSKGTSMRKLLQILRLYFEAKLSQRNIAKSLSLSVGVVSKYINRALDKNISWPLPPGMDEPTLRELLQPKANQSTPSKTLDSIDFVKTHQELSRKGVTLQLLWEEYESEQEAALSYSRYCHHYRVYKKSLKRSLRQTQVKSKKCCKFPLIRPISLAC
jgi:transposase